MEYSKLNEDERKWIANEMCKVRQILHDGFNKNFTPSEIAVKAAKKFWKIKHHVTIAAIVFSSLIALLKIILRRNRA